MKENPNPNENVPAFAPEIAFSEMDMQARMRWIRRKTLEHLWGPTGSILLHGLLIVLALRYLTIESRPPDVTVEVRMMELRETRLDELQQALEQLREPERDFERPEVDVTMDAVPDDQPVEMREPMADFAALDIRTDVQSPLIVKDLFGRTEAGRAALGEQFSNPRIHEPSTNAVLRALDWLRDAQLADGSWSGTGTAVSKTAMTGLALLTFLSYGQTHTSERYGDTVRRAIVFLVEKDLRPDGTFTHVDGGWYGHGIAAYALSEAFAMTRIVSIRPAMELAIRRIIQGQQRTGSFNYRLIPADTRRDTSFVGWMAQAKKGAFLAGANVPGLRASMNQTIAGIKINFDRSNKMFAYAPGGAVDDQGGGDGAGRPGMTPIAVLGLQLLGRGRDEETLAGLSTMQNWTPHWNEQAFQWPLYTWYYATLAIFNGGGKTWERWHEQFARMLIENQNADGSWSPIGRNEAPYGPVYGTVFSALSLMVYYRALPTLQPVAAEEPPTETRTDDAKIDML